MGWGSQLGIRGLAGIQFTSLLVSHSADGIIEALSRALGP